MVLEGGIAVLSEGRSIGKKLSEPLTLRGTFENAQGASATLCLSVNVQFHGQAGAALGELRGELDFERLASGLFFQDFLDGYSRQRRKMKLQAARDDGRQKRVRRRCGKNKRCRAGRLFENFQDHASDIPTHGLRAIEDKNAAAAHGLKVSGTLDGAQLADPQHRASYRSLQADGIGHERPDVRVRLQNQRNTFDHGRVGTLAALDETLLEQRLRIGKLGDTPTRGAFAAEVV